MSDPIDMHALIEEAGIHDCTGKGTNYDDACICCNRGMTDKQVEKAVYLHMTTSNTFVPLDANADDTQGLHQVGSSCAAKIRKALKARGLNPKEWVGKCD
jgi:bacterioferritin-associated ferredoxin